MMGSMAAEFNPKIGILEIPFMGFQEIQTVGMKPREILAANFQKLRDASPALNRLPAVTAAGGGTNGTLDRITRAVTAVNIDALEPLATAYGLEAWQLLCPGLEASKGPLGRAKIKGLPDWPFPLLERARFEALNPEMKAYVQAKMAAAMDEAEQLQGKPQPAGRQAPAFTTLDQNVTATSAKKRQTRSKS